MNVKGVEHKLHQRENRANQLEGAGKERYGLKGNNVVLEESHSLSLFCSSIARISLQ